MLTFTVVLAPSYVCLPFSLTAVPTCICSVGNGLTFMCGRVKNNGASENKCEHGHSPKVCTLQCAEIMVPFYKQCESKINKNPEMKSLMDKCLDTEMNSVDALLRRIKGLREKGCTVDLTGIDSGSAINKQCHCRTGFEPCCHRRHLAQQQSPPPPHNLTVAESRRQLQGKSCQIGESRRVQQSCCSGKSSCRDGVPNMCSAECALEYGTFWCAVVPSYLHCMHSNTIHVFECSAKCSCCTWVDHRRPLLSIGCIQGLMSQQVPWSRSRAIKKGCRNVLKLGFQEIAGGYRRGQVSLTPNSMGDR